MTKTHELKQIDKATILKEITMVGSSSYMAHFLNMVRGFIIAGFLDPAVYGIWNLLKIFIYSSEFFGFGTSDALAREVPLNEGRQLQQWRKRNLCILQTSLSWGLLTSGLVSMTVFLLTFTPLINQYQVEVRLATIALILLYPVYFAKEKFYSEDKMMLLSQTRFAFAFLNTLFGLSFLFLYGLRGLLVGQILTSFALLLYLALKRFLSFSFQIHKETLIRLLKIGFPLMLISISFSIMQKIDTIMICAFLGSTKTGYYGLAAFMTTTIHYLPSSISSVLFPKMMYRYGQTSEKGSIEEFFRKPMRILSLVIPIFLGLAVINISLPIVYILPKYIPAISVLKILFIGLIFSCLTTTPMDILIAFNKQRKLLLITILALLFGTILDYGVISLHFGINGVAVATGFIFFLVSFFMNIYVLFLFQKRGKEILFLLIKIYYPIVYCLSVLWILGFFVVYEKSIIFQCIMRSIGFLVLILPLIWSFLKEVKVRGH